VIYFDQSATSLWKPEGVAGAIQHALQTGGNAGRGAHGASLASGRMDFKVRRQVAGFFGAPDPAHVIFTSGATESLNIALFGLVEAGDHVVTTWLEHNSVLRPLYALEDRGVALSIVSPRTDRTVRPVSVEDLRAVVRPATKVIAVTHASNVLGLVHDIRAIGEFCADRGILLVVDASQTAGLLPINVAETGIACLCCSAHKSLLGPQGLGAMILGRGVRPSPLLFGGTGADSFARSMPESLPERYEAGTLNTPGIAGLGAAMDYIEGYGIGNLHAEAMRLAELFYQGAIAIPGLAVYGGDPGNSTQARIPVVALNVGDRGSGEVADALWQSAEIAVRPGAHCAPLVHKALQTVSQGMVRFSFSHKNTEQEVGRALRVLEELAEEGHGGGR